MQFIVTTNSPQVVSSVPKECIRIIHQGKVIPCDMQTKGVEYQNILAGRSSIDPALQQDVIVPKLAGYARLEAMGKADSKEGRKLYLVMDEHVRKDYAHLQRIEN